MTSLEDQVILPRLRTPTFEPFLKRHSNPRPSSYRDECTNPSTQGRPWEQNEAISSLLESNFESASGRRIAKKTKLSVSQIRNLYLNANATIPLLRLRQR